VKVELKPHKPACLKAAPASPEPGCGRPHLNSCLAASRRRHAAAGQFRGRRTEGRREFLSGRRLPDVCWGQM